MKPTFQNTLRAISTWRLDEKRRSNGAYFVLAAIRGGDDEFDPSMQDFKSLITARIRGIVFQKNTCQGEITTDVFSSANLTRLKATVASVPRQMAGTVAISHYALHLLDAVLATHKHPIWGGLAEGIVVELRRVT